MANLNSGNQEVNSRLIITFYLPLLALLTVSLPLAYAFFSLSQDAQYQVHFYLFLLLALLYFWGTFKLTNWMLLLITAIISLGIPLISVQLLTQNGEIPPHAIVFLVSSLLAWAPALIVREIACEELAAMKGNIANKRKGGTLSNNIIIILIVLLGSLVFIGGSFYFSASNTTTTLPAGVIYFAAPFYLVTFALLSLGKMTQITSRDVQRPLAITGNFMRRWTITMLAILAISLLLASVIPKSPLTSVFSPNGDASIDSPFSILHRQNNDEPFSTNKDLLPRTSPGNNNAAQPDADKNASATTHGQDNPQLSPDKTGRTTTDGERGERGPGNSREQNPETEKPETETEAYTPHTPTDTNPSSSQANQVSPTSLWDLLILLLVEIFSLAYIVWCLLRPQRRQLIANKAFTLGDNPFDDPFLKLNTATPARLSQAVYASFIAYLWLLGLTRTTNMTEMAFAIWLENNSQLDTTAFWIITRQCNCMFYANNSLTPEELDELHTALRVIMRQATNRLSDIEFQVKQQQYLRELQQASPRRYA